jgi:hypothetical protein
MIDYAELIPDSADVSTPEAGSIWQIVGQQRQETD